MPKKTVIVKKRSKVKSHSSEEKSGSLFRISSAHSSHVAGKESSNLHSSSNYSCPNMVTYYMVTRKS